MEEEVTAAGLAGNGVGEGNDGNAVAGWTVKVGSGILDINSEDSVAVGTTEAGGVSLRTFNSEITTS